MKQNLLFILLFMSACNNENKAILQPPSDSLLIQHIKAQYSFENKNDGAEFATVDTLFIIAKEPNEDRRWRIIRHKARLANLSCDCPE